MRATAAHIAAVLLIVHAMFGCCRCHWHSDSCETVESVAACCPCCQSHSTDSDSQQHAPCEGDRECQGVCKYLPSQRVTVDDAARQVDFLPVTVDTCGRGSICAHVEMQWRYEPDCNDTPPPLRLHLLNQILLI